MRDDVVMLGTRTVVFKGGRDLSVFKQQISKQAIKIPNLVISS